MKIATWNLERGIKKKSAEILQILRELRADILILTEGDPEAHPENYFCECTISLPDAYEGITYKAGENRACIYSKFPIVALYPTHDPFTSVCADIKTPSGVLTVYGTIIGVFANRQPRFNEDLQGVLDDLGKLGKKEFLCVAGDLNTTFSGHTYPSHEARNKLLEMIASYDLKNPTGEIEDNVDHILLSSAYCRKYEFKTDTWNTDKKLSDHIGVALSIS